MPKITVPYEHNPADLQAIHIAITATGHPAKDAWLPAYRDTVNGRRVIWVRVPEQNRTVSVWVRDNDGARQVDTVTLTAHAAPSMTDRTSSSTVS